MDRVYMAHEYLDEHWQLFQFSEMVDRLGEAKLSFVASAALPENLDVYTIPADLRPLIAEMQNFRLREAVRECAAIVASGAIISRAERRRSPAPSIGVCFRN